MTAQNVIYVGADVAKDNVVVAVAVAVKGAVAVSMLTTVDNTIDGFKALRRELTKLRQKHRGHKVQLVIEPTGGYEMALAVFGHQQNWQVCLVNPKHVREWANSQGQRAKTDAWDARMLAEYAAQRPKDKPLPLWQPLPESLSQLESLLRRRNDLEEMLRQEDNRRAMWAMRPGSDPAVLDTITHVLRTLQDSLDAINQAITELIDQDPGVRQELEHLDSVPGVGDKLVMPLFVLFAKWQAMTHGHGSAKQLTAYVGLDAQTHQSGRSTRRGGISKTGDPEIRRLLFMAALGGKHGHNPLHDFYVRLVGNGKLKMVALVAAARKILLWAWAVFRDHVFFDPSKFAQTA